MAATETWQGPIPFAGEGWDLALETPTYTEAPAGKCLQEDWCQVPAAAGNEMQILVA